MNIAVTQDEALWPGGAGKNLVRGEVDETRAMYVLALPAIREAEIIEAPKTLNTKTGHVIARPGDVAITAYDGEQFPIRAAIFYGAYEVLGQLGPHVIARRLIQVRTAWTVTSPDAELNYGGDRGKAQVTRGGWLYQSDEDDFGLVNAQTKHQGHDEVGPIRSVLSERWPSRYRALSWFLGLLPPVLTLIALLTSFLPGKVWKGWEPRPLIGLETVLLLIGVAGYAWTRIGRWEKKAAVGAGAREAEEFQLAVELLGQRGSRFFPHMSLWRAAQGAPGGVPPLPPEEARMTGLRERVGRLIEDIQRRRERIEFVEKLIRYGTVVALVLAVGGHLWILLKSQQELLELVLLWLPSGVSALHLWEQRSRISDRVPALKGFEKRLQFILKRLMDLQPWSATEADEVTQGRQAALRLLCRVVGLYCQAELRLAMGRRPGLPV